MLRFDFILDEDIDIHLLKVKLSPTLHAEGKSSQLETLFEQIAYNLFNIVGIGSHLGGRTSLTIRYFISLKIYEFLTFQLFLETTKKN